MAKRKADRDEAMQPEERIKALEAELARYRRGTPAMQAVADILHTFPCPIALLDAEGRILRANEGFARLLGCASTTEMRGRALDELAKGEHLALLARGDEVVWKEGKRFAYDAVWSAEDGSRRYFSIIKVPLGAEQHGARLMLLLLQEATSWWKGREHDESYLMWWNTLADFVHLIFAQESEEEMMKAVARWFREQLGYGCVAFYFLDERKKHLVRHLLSAGCEALAVAREGAIALGEGHWLERALAGEEGVYRRLPDGEVVPFAPLPPGEPVAFAFPVGGEEGTRGVFVLASEEHRGLDAVAVDAMRLLLVQLRRALHVMHIQARLHVSLRISELLAEVTRQIEQARSYEELLRALLPILHHLRLDGVTLRLLGRRERDLYLADIHTLRELSSAPKYAVTRELPMSRQFVDSLFYEREYLFYPDVADPELDVPDEIREQMRQRGLRSSITFPLRVRGRLIGMLVLYGALPMNEEEISQLFYALRDIVTYSVDRLRLFRQMEETIRQRELLYSALAELSASSTYDELLDALRKHTFLGEADRNISLNLFNQPWEDEMPDWSIVIARWTSLPEEVLKPRYALHLFPEAEQLLQPDMPTIIEDLAADTRLSAVTKQLYAKQFKGGSTIFFPLLASGKWIGYLNAIFGEPRHFPLEEVRTVMTLINQAAVIVQSLVRLQEMERRTQRLFAAAEVSKAATAITDLDRLLTEAVELIRERFGLYYAGIFLVDEQRKWAVLRAGTGEAGRKMLEAGHRLEVGGRSMIGACVATGEARIALDVGREAVRFNNPYLPETRSEMALPLRSGGETIGAMTIQSTEEAAFSEEDIVVLQTMADQLANAIQVSRLLRTTERHLEQLRAAYGDYTIEAWRRLVQRSGSLGYRYRGLDVEMVQEKGPLAERAWREGKPVYGRDEKTGMAAVAVPIKLRERVIGVLMMRAREGEIEAGAVETVQAIGDRLAMALETTRLLEETRRRVMREHLVTQVGARVREQLEIESVLETALRELGRILDVRRGVAYLSTRKTSTPDVEMEAQ